MARQPTHLLDVLDARPLLKSSRIRVAGIRARGIPAVLVGAAAIVFAAGLTEALKRAATALPETVRETRKLILTARAARELPSSN